MNIRYTIFLAVQFLIALFSLSPKLASVIAFIAYQDTFGVPVVSSIFQDCILSKTNGVYQDAPPWTTGVACVSRTGYWAAKVYVVAGAGYHAVETLKESGVGARQRSGGARVGAGSGLDGEVEVVAMDLGVIDVETELDELEVRGEGVDGGDGGGDEGQGQGQGKGQVGEEERGEGGGIEGIDNVEGVEEGGKGEVTASAVTDAVDDEEL